MNLRRNMNGSAAAQEPTAAKPGRRKKKPGKRAFSRTANAILIVAAVALLIASFLFPVLMISGDSMEPDFSDGDEVYVEFMDEIPVGKTGIFVYNGKGLIKQFCGDHLESLNKKYKPIWPEDDIPFRTVGLVLGKVDWGDDE